MPSPRVAVAMPIGGDRETKLARAYAGLYKESKNQRRPSRSALEVGLRFSNVVVWMYAGVVFVHSMP